MWPDPPNPSLQITYEMCLTDENLCFTPVDSIYRIEPQSITAMRVLDYSMVPVLGTIVA